MFHAFKFATCAVLPAVLACPAAAVGLADWDISDATSGASITGPVTGNALAPNVTAGSMTTVGVSNVSSSGNKANALGGNSWNSGAFDVNDEYVSFSLTPEAGYTLDLNTIHFNEGANNSVGVNAQWQLRSSLDNFASVITSASINNGFEDIAAAGAYVSIALDADFDDVQSQIEFRLYGTGFDSFQGQWFIADPTENFSNFTVEGSVALIPEPATIALLGLGGLALIRRRRA